MNELTVKNDKKEVTTKGVGAMDLYDTEGFKNAVAMANFYAKSDLLPSPYKGNPANILIAMDVAYRTGMGLLMVTQTLDVIKGRPGWEGKMCIALVDASKRFSKLEFERVGKMGEDSFGCYAHAVSRENGKEYISATITIKMAKDEGWYYKDGSKWKTMPEQMLIYRAGSFFAKAYCPDLLLGVQTAEEIEDFAEDDNNLKSILEEE